MYFTIDGYWKDTKEPFEGYIVKDSHDYTEDEDEDIFFYGLSEKDLQGSLNDETTIHDFVITSYEPLN